MAMVGEYLVSTFYILSQYADVFSPISWSKSTSQLFPRFRKKGPGHSDRDFCLRFDISAIFMCTPVISRIYALICYKSGKVIRYPTEADQIRNTSLHSTFELLYILYICLQQTLNRKPQDFQIKHPKAHVPHTEFGCSSWAAVDAIAVRHQFYIYLGTIN